MPEPVYVIGAGRTDFKRNFKKEGRSIRNIIVEAARAAVADAGIDPGDVQAGVVGNFAGGLFTRQLHLGAFLTEIDDRLRGIPALHVVAACASGGVAVLTAAQQIMGGLRDVVLVVGAERQKAPMCWPRRAIITRKHRATANSCSPSCSPGSRRFTWNDTA